LFAPVISWWTASANVWMLVAVGTVGLFILWRQQRFHVALAFLCVFLLGETVLRVAQGTHLEMIPSVVRSVIFNGSLLFFMTVMLIEPITSNFPTWKNRIAYGALVGFFSILSLLIVGHVPLNDLDPLIVGLLLGNLVASLLFLAKATPVAST